MTRANTERPKAGGEHSDALESGLPSDRKSEGAGTEHTGTGVKAASSENRLEKGDYPEPGEGTSGGGGTNHRVLPTPSKEDAHSRGMQNARGVMGGGRGESGKFRGTMGGGEVEPKAKGCIGQ